jgi:hypothetical protein
MKVHGVAAAAGLLGGALRPSTGSPGGNATGSDRSGLVPTPDALGRKQAVVFRLAYDPRFVEIPARASPVASARQAMDQTVQRPLGRRINWSNVATVLSAAVLIGAEVFGAAYAGGWAVSNLFQLGDYGVYALQVVFFLIGIAVMVAFVRNAQRVEPFTRRN